MTERAVFLDRDGVVNRAVVVDGRPYPPASLEQLELLPGVPDAIASFRKSGFRVIVVTNQPDVGTGRQAREVVQAMHDSLRECLTLDDIYACYHTDQHACACRKPKPGMLLDAAQKWAVQLQESFMVGDRWRDIEAGHRAGCKTILVQGEEAYREPAARNPNWIVRSLLEASRIICPAGNAITPARQLIV
jgi:D-glycero-D-manno-heptose 1,7-bisphosphate phosphatase